MYSELIVNLGVVLWGTPPIRLVSVVKGSYRLTASLKLPVNDYRLLWKDQSYTVVSPIISQAITPDIQ
jgi:hypothetical protein